MPSTYCSSCGHKMTYTLQKPKFCSECGQSLATLQPSPKTQRKVYLELCKWLSNSTSLTKDNFIINGYFRL